MRRALAAASLLLLTTACFGRLSIALTQQIDPRPILPGATLQQEIAIEGEGLLGAAARQAMTQSTNATTTGWQLRDNSDGTTVRFHMLRSVPMDASGTRVQSSFSGDPGKVQVASDDWIVVRRYHVQVDVSTPESAVAPTSNDAQSQQLAQLVLAGISYDHYLRMPGIVTSTNGTRTDDGRIGWHVSFTSASTQESLMAESIYPDAPRAALLVALIIGLVFARFAISRRRTAAPAPPA